MAKSRYQKKNKSNRRKTQHKMSQRGGSWLFGDSPEEAAAKLKAKADAEEQDKLANPTPETKPADPSAEKTMIGKISSFLGFKGGRRGRKSSRRSNLKRKL